MSGTRRERRGLESEVMREREAEEGEERRGHVEERGGRGRRTAARGGGEKRAPPQSPSAAETEGSTVRGPKCSLACLKIEFGESTEKMLTV